MGLGKLKNITKKDRNISEEREFGSGSDISSASVQSKQSTSSKMSTASRLIQRARSASKDRMAGGKDKTDDKAKKGTPFGPPGNANAAFDKYGGGAATPTTKTGASPAAAPAKAPAATTNS